MSESRSRIRTPDNFGRAAIDIGHKDLLPHYSDFFDSEDWKKMYEPVVSAAALETHAPGVNTDALKRLNFTMGLIMATQKGQTIEQLHHDLQQRVKGSIITRNEAINGIQFAFELGINTIRINEADIVQLRIAFSAPQGRT